MTRLVTPASAARVRTSTVGVPTSTAGVSTSAVGVRTSAARVATSAAGVSASTTGVSTSAVGVPTSAAGVSASTVGVSTSTVGGSTFAAGIPAGAAASARRKARLMVPWIGRSLRSAVRGGAVRPFVRDVAGDERPPAENVATVVQRLSIIIGAGVAPDAAWRYLDDGSTAARSPSVEPVVAAVRVTGLGRSIVGAILESAPRTGPAEPLWRIVAAAWHVSEATGAPLATCLTDIATSLLDVGTTERAIGVALAAPTATSRLVLALPAVGVIFGTLLGFDTIPFLVTTPAGVLCAVTAAALVVSARRWNRRLVRGVAPVGRAPGLLLDLTIIALASGRSVPSATAAVADATARCDLARATTDAERRDRDGVLALAARIGVSPGVLLASAAQATRRDARSSAARNAEKLGTQLLVPLGLCVLPAFILLGVVPIIAGILSTSLRVL